MALDDFMLTALKIRQNRELDQVFTDQCFPLKRSRQAAKEVSTK